MPIGTLSLLSRSVLNKPVEGVSLTHRSIRKFQSLTLNLRNQQNNFRFHIRLAFLFRLSFSRLAPILSSNISPLLGIGYDENLLILPTVFSDYYFRIYSLP